MERMCRSLGVKFLAVILSFVFLLTGVAGGIACGYMVVENYFLVSDFGETTSGQQIVTSELYHVAWAYDEYVNVVPGSFPTEFQAQISPYIEGFQIRNESGTVLYTYGDMESVYDGNTLTSSYYSEQNGWYLIEARYRLMELESWTQRFELQIFELLFPLRYWIVALTAICAVCYLLVLAFLLVASGHVKGQDGITLNWIDRIPLDLFAVVVFFCVAPSCVAIADCWGRGYDWILSVLLIIVVYVLLFISLLTLSTRLKAGKWWENTLIYRILRLLRKCFCGIGRWLRYVGSYVPFLWKWLILLAAVDLFGFIFLLAAGNVGLEGLAVIGMLVGFVLSVLAVWFGCQLHSLRKAGEKLAAGESNVTVDTRYMFGECKEHGQVLGQLSAVVQASVEERLKSERMKAELITNVSHDIKTPLTSILNYVDLLQKEDLQNEKATEYLEVLARQSQKLKRLTENIVDASKAATGNLPVNMDALNLTEFLRQTVGEYEERFVACDLTPVLFCPVQDIVVQADGKLLWRVFDNLFQNICKYAQPGTRCYINATHTPQETAVVIKNVSKDPLNMSEEELMERFVRGDNARTGDGNGLGLSIAKSLMELQHANLRIFIDGDLFKVFLSFPHP